MGFGVFSCPLMKGWCLLIYIENLVGLSTEVMEYKMWALNGLLDLLSVIILCFNQEEVMIYFLYLRISTDGK